MIKLAAFPKCFIDDIHEGRMSLLDWIEMASHLQIDGIEMYDKFLPNFKHIYLKRIKKEAQNRNLEIPMMCYSPDFTNPDRAKRIKEIGKQKDMIKVIVELGGKYCRVLSGQKWPNVKIRDGISWVVEAIEKCLDTAKEFGVVLVMENHYKDSFWEFPEFAQKSEVFLEIIDQIDSPFFGVQYDPSNAIIAGEDPLELLNRTKYRILTMHASDRFLLQGTTLEELKQTDGTIGYSPKLSHGVIGKGLNDYDAIFQTLAEVNFSGWISIEDGMNGIEEIEQSAIFLKNRMSHFGLYNNKKSK